ncbi:MAG TPA: ABC transporter permease [Terriglobales bacterium]|nr:ABC transporter permease [Terriglobales bacterium]
MESVLQDIRFALRTLRMQLGFAAVAIVTLALGIGANSAVFSVVNAVVLRPLPFNRPAELYDVRTRLSQFGPEAVSLPDYKDWRDQSTHFEQMAAYFGGSANLGGATEPERTSFLRASPNLFSVLQVKPVLGRLLVEDDDRPGAPPVAVLSYGFWQRKFGGRADVLGQAVTLNTTSYTVVGVAPPEVQMFNPADVIAALGLTPEQVAKLGRRNDFLRIVARAKPGTSYEQLESQLRDVAGRLEREYPATNKGVGVMLSSLQKHLVGDAGPVLFSLWAAVGFMLMIVCVNMANLMLARGTARDKEMAIRTALGARSQRLIRQLLTEGVVLAFLASCVALLLAYWGIQALHAFAPKELPFVSRIHLDRPVLAFTAILGLGTGLLFSLIPALQARGTNLHDSLKQGGKTSSTGGRHGLRKVLVISEVAISLVLLAGAGLMIRTVRQLQNTRFGITPDHVLTFRVSLPAGKYKDAQQVAFFERLLADLRSKPGVVSAGATSNLYIESDSSYLTFQLQGAPPLPDGEGIDAQVRSITPNYLEAMGVSLLRGRSFTDADRDSTNKVAVVNQALVDQHFPGQDLLGRKLTIDGNDWYEIVGISSNVKQRGAEQQAYPEINLPLAQSATPSMTVVLRTAIDPTALVPTIHSTVASLDPTLPVYAVQTMDEVLSENRAGRSFQAGVLVAFAVLALLLAGIGIYGVMEQSVAQRVTEFGVRMALGAHPSEVLALAFRQGIVVALIGLALGLAGSLALGRFMQTFIFGITAHDPITFVVVSILMTAIAMLACYIPARRAMKVDPMVALRYE